MSGFPVDAMTAYLQRVLDKIREVGWVVQGVGGEPPFVYTVGLARKGLPEILVLGLPTSVGMTALNTLAVQMIAGDLKPEEGEIYHDKVFKGVSAKFKKLPNAQVRKVLKIACIINNNAPPPAMQLIWPDVEGRFPGEEGTSASFEASQDVARVV